MSIANLIAGPHLIGLVFLIVGSIMRMYPPKYINGMYGYRTNSSMKNQETWDEANRFSARYTQRCGIVLVIIGIISVMILNNVSVPVKVLKWLKPLLTLLPLVIAAILLIVVTERHLKKVFTDK